MPYAFRYLAFTHNSVEKTRFFCRCYSAESCACKISIFQVGGFKVAITKCGTSEIDLGKVDACKIAILENLHAQIREDLKVGFSPFVPPCYVSLDDFLL